MRLALFGASGHGRVTLNVARDIREFNIIAAFDDDEKKHGDDLDGLEILGGFDELRRQATNLKVGGVLIAIGNNQARHEIAKSCVRNDLNVAGFIHPHARVASGCSIDPSSMIWPGVIINIGTTIGKSCIVNTGAIIEHDCNIDDYAFVGPGAVLCGDVKVGQESWVGAGATVIQQRSIGKQSTIGAGAVVTKDIKSNVVASGVPCKPHA